MAQERQSLAEVFRIFLGLGLTSFGGPVAHLGYFREAFVQRRQWLSEAQYADLVALCQFLPGPASSQVGLAIGASRAGVRGAMAAWLGFTMPSALALMAVAYGFAAAEGWLPGGVLQGLKAVAVAVVANAVWGMAQRLWADRRRATLGLAVTVGLVVLPGTMPQLAAIAVGALAGWWWFREEAASDAHEPLAFGVTRSTGTLLLGVFFGLLAGLPVLAWATSALPLALLDTFYRAGSLVFGGGHVVLPLLQAEVVPPGWVGNEAFLAGYGAAQAIPGPLFTFSAYLGTVTGLEAGAPGWLLGLLCLAAIFLPAYLLLLGVLPHWEALRRLQGVQAALRGVNAAVVGLLLAALYTPVWTAGVQGPRHFAVVVAAFGLLVLWKLPAWAVVILAAVAGGFVL